LSLLSTLIDESQSGKDTSSNKNPVFRLRRENGVLRAQIPRANLQVYNGS
jgi:hypothetical protein